MRPQPAPQHVQHWKNLMKRILFSGLAGALVLSGCASMAVTDDAIVDRTSRALGVDKGTFTIADRVDEGTATRYVAKTRSGDYNCTIGGSFSVIGRVVSDAICNKKGEAPKNPLLR
jgi:hypothetical protein